MSKTKYVPMRRSCHLLLVRYSVEAPFGILGLNITRYGMNIRIYCGMGAFADGLGSGVPSIESLAA